MGLTMHLFGVKTEYKQTPVGFGMKREMWEIGYWRKAWLIFYWFRKYFNFGDSECPVVYFDDYVLEDLIKDCKDTVEYYDKYENAHRKGTVKEEIPDNCLLGDVWDYFFYNRYEKSAFIYELEYTINLCEQLLKKGKYETYCFEASI